MATEDSSIGSLEHTPTWALATVCLVFISVSIVLEHIFHLLTNWLKRNRRTSLSDAMDKLKSELMLLGFMSLMLAAARKPIISKICIKANLADSMLPCRKEVPSKLTAVQTYGDFASNFVGNLFLENDILWRQDRRLLADEEEGTYDAGAISDDPCSSKGKVSLISEDGIDQLHKFIFVLAVTQIVYSVLTLALGWTKMRRWKAWEKETRTTEYQVANDPNRFRLTRQTTFGRRHMKTCTNTSALLWIKCFFRQFFHSVAKVDYLTLRHGFISAHLSTKNVHNFNFQKYIQRSLDEDFKAVVSVSPLMWFLVVIFLLVDVHGWNVYLWVSYVPLLIVLVVGTKLEVIVAKMALRIDDQSVVSRGTPLVQPNDNLFWFGHPRFVLVLIHYTLFVNAFEFAFFIWVTIQFGPDSCFHEHTAFIVTRVVLAISVQVICSYITLPLYALVTQMGSQFKSKVLEEQVAKIIKQWHAEVRERRKKQNQHSPLSPRSTLRTDEQSIKRGSPMESPRPAILHGITISSKKEEIAKVQENKMKNKVGSSIRGPIQEIKLGTQTTKKV